MIVMCAARLLLGIPTHLSLSQGFPIFERHHLLSTLLRFAVAIHAPSPTTGAAARRATAAVWSACAPLRGRRTRMAKLREEQTRAEQERIATMPTVDSNGGRGGEVVYANSTRKAILMPDLRGRSVRDVARTCAQLGLQVEARGEGRVFKQSPAAGSEVNSGQTIYVDFGRSQ